MNKLISLIKVDFKNTYSISSLVNSFKTKKNIWTTLVIFLSLLSLLPSYYLMIRGLGSFYDAFFQLGQASYLLHLGIFSSQFVVLFLGSFMF